MQHDDIDHTGLTGVSTVSYASNANAVAGVSAGGAAATLSRGDHVHDGVTSISHTSNTFDGPVTITASGTLGITSPAAGTYNFSAVDTAGSGSSTPTLVADRVVRTSADITTTSTSFVDATGLTVTLTTGARRCLVTASGTLSNTNVTNNMIDIAVDGTRQGGDLGLQLYGVSTANTGFSIAYLTDVLTAGEHTIKLQWRTGAGTATLYATTAVTPAVFSVQELL